MSVRFTVPVLLGALLLAGCASGPITTWPYSSWYNEGAAASLGSFEAKREACLAQVGASADPAAVAKDSSQADQFLICMNGSQWCTQAFKCEKSGAS